MKKILLFITIVFLLHNANAQSWIPQGHGLLPIGYVVLSISAVDDTVLWVTAGLESVVSSGNPVPLDHKLKVLRSVDGGLNWQTHDVANGRFSTDIVAVSADTAWITTQTYGNGIERALFKTEDGGFTWKNKLIHRAASVFLRRFDDTHLMCQSNKYAAWSEDGGEFWNVDTLTSYLPNEFNTLNSGNNVASFVGDTLWVGTSLGRIARFINFGASYEMIYTGTIFEIQSVSFADHLRGMIFHYDGTIGAFGLSRTYDGGNTWTLTPSKPQTTEEYNITFVPGTIATFVAVSKFTAAAGEYFWTTDFGETWSKGGEIMNAQTNAVKFLTPTIGWASTGTVTRANEPIVYRWLGDLTTSVHHQYESLSGFEVSPNPATSTIYYHFDDDEINSHERTVVDIQGRVLQSEITSSSELDITMLPVGTYFLKIKSDNKVGTLMFVKISE